MVKPKLYAMLWVKLGGFGQIGKQFIFYLTR
jgi:hypothetical protein